MGRVTCNLSISADLTQRSVTSCSAVAGAPFYTARTTPGLAALICQTGRDFGASERTLERYGTRLPAID